MENNQMEIWPDTNVPWERRRKEIVQLLCKEEYGFCPPPPQRLTWEEEMVKERFCAGKAPLKRVTLTAQLEEGTFSFPIYTVIPKKGDKLPFFVLLSFRDEIPNEGFPAEEICDRGYGVVMVCYQDVTADNGDFDSGLAKVVFRGRERSGSDCGKIALWAWAASRALDYALSLPRLDSSRAAVIGHSRLGKTALLAGALDERFSYVISNDSGCSGAAISRGKQGETIQVITDVFPYWFCPRYQQYAGREEELPFDQHFLLAASAPRKVYVASAREDIWADPQAEKSACRGADEVYKKLEMAGFIGTGDLCHGGNIAYHVRDGEHYLSREDWNHFMDYMEGK